MPYLIVTWRRIKGSVMWWLMRRMGRAPLPSEVTAGPNVHSELARAHRMKHLLAGTPAEAAWDQQINLLEFDIAHRTHTQRKLGAAAIRSTQLLSSTR